MHRRQMEVEPNRWEMDEQTSPSDGEDAASAGRNDAKRRVCTKAQLCAWGQDQHPGFVTLSLSESVKVLNSSQVILWWSQLN